MKSPLIIIAELLSGLISGIYQTIVFILGKFGELMVSLLFLSVFGIHGFFLALAIGAIVFLLLVRFIFKTTKTILGFGIALAVVIAILVLLWLV